MSYLKIDKFLTYISNKIFQREGIFEGNQNTNYPI